MMKRLLALVFVLGLLASQTGEAQQNMRVRSHVILADYNVASATYVFCDSGSPPTGIRCSTGSAADDGWVTVNGATLKTIQVEIDTITATSLDFKVEARLYEAEDQGAQIYPGTGDDARTATGSFIISIPDPVYQIRLGIKVTGDTGTQDVDAVLNIYEARR